MKGRSQTVGVRLLFFHLFTVIRDASKRSSLLKTQELIVIHCYGLLSRSTHLNSRATHTL